MNDSFRLSKSFIRCNDSVAESLRRFGRPFSPEGFAFFLDMMSPQLIFLSISNAGDDTKSYAFDASRLE
jgi:hypothetical protein